LTGASYKYPHPSEIEQKAASEALLALLIALGVIGVWAASLVCLLLIDLNQITGWIIPAAMLWQMFLYTGLFITAHDAMHGAIFPSNIKVNNAIGTLCVLLYGLFSYKKLLRKHWMHHHHPASELDPDFHDGKHKNPIVWYLYFMQNYWSWRRLLGLMLIFNLAGFFLQIPEQNLLLFWVIPSIASSLQLFFFGTFLPHREPKGGYPSAHRAKTFALPTLLSFLACYHFGYHEEHHEYPRVPWWRLPQVYQARLKSAS